MAASSVSLKEYLKRYESDGGADEPNKKKKRKKKKAKPDAMPGVIVVDEDPVWQKPVPLEEEEEDSPGEEQPIVDEDIEVKRMKRLEAIRSKKPYHAISEDGSGWIAITNLSKQSEESADRGNGNDLSLPRQHRARFDTPSPSREQRLSAKPDLSPPRQARKSPAGDISSARRARKGSPEDLSPPRKVRQSSEDIPDPREDMVSADLSPPRRRRRHSSDDISPPHMAHNQFKDSAKLQEAAGLADLSPPKRRRRDSPDDLSPPRRRQRDSPNNLSPPRRKRRDTQDDLSLPRWAHHSSLDGNRPRGSPTADLSPPRRNQQHSSETVKPYESNVDDLSPPRITRKESHADDLSPPRKARKELSSSTAARRSGLFSAQEIKEELDTKRKEEISRFAAMDPSISGRGAEPVFRDKEGRRISKEEMLKSQEEEKPKDKKLEWGKGLAQKREAEARALELEHEKERPFARNRDDPELDKMLKEKIRWGDPMAHLVKRKHSEPVLEDLGDDEKMKESGFIIPQTIPSHSWIKRGLDFPPNRYGIRPGRHWDGVDRSNGYEKELFKRQNEKRATEAEAYLWSVSDM